MKRYLIAVRVDPPQLFAFDTPEDRALFIGDLLKGWPGVEYATSELPTLELVKEADCDTPP